MARRASIERLARVSLLSAVALVLSYVETMIPLPVALPGVKLGLANVAVAVALFELDARSAACVALVKVLASGLLFGSPMMLAYSLGGTVLAFAGMLALSCVPGVGVLPVSMLAAVLHNAGQLVVAALALGTPAVFVNMPVLAVAACVTGGVTGAAAEAALASLEGAVSGVAGADGADGGAGGVPETVRAGRPHVDLGGFMPAAGEVTAFVGANGSGKTSCALELAGLLCGATPAWGEGRVGVAFQDPDDQIVADIVRDDVAFGPENVGLERGRLREAVERALEEAGAVELASREADALSGGQKQRVAVAGLLALAPGMMVFDEATAMLDPAARESFGSLVRSLADRGAAVVVITQLMDEAFEADRIVVFRDAAVAFVGTPAQLLERACGVRPRAAARRPPCQSAARVGAWRPADERHGRT